MDERVIPKKRELRQLTGVRIVAALWVVFFHFDEQVEVLVPELDGLGFLSATGYLAVDLFFVLSGYILAYQYIAKFPRGRGDYVGFLVKRLARIYPVLAATTLLLVVVVSAASLVGLSIGNPDSFTFWGAVSDLTLTRGWIIPTQGWNFPAWSLSAEWLAYLAFPPIGVLAVWAAARSKGVVVALFGVLVVAEGVFTAVATGANDMPFPTLRVLVAFTGGVALYVVLQHTRVTDLAGWIGGVALLALVAATPFVPVGPARAAVALALALLIVGALAVGSGPVVRLLGSPPLEYGGRISFSVYMVHGIALMVLVRVVDADRWSDAALPARAAIVVAEIAAVVVAGALVYRLIEIPAQRAIVGALARRRARRLESADGGTLVV
jgi:peptidoglycan/LPS O-acetylase OafA/YrhL